MISTVTVSNIAILLFDTYRGRNLGPTPDHTNRAPFCAVMTVSGWR